MNSSDENEPASPVLPQTVDSQVLTAKFGRELGMGALKTSPVSSLQSELSQELRRLDLGIHSRQASHDSQLSSQTSFSLRDISNSKDFLHRRTASKLLTFERTSTDNYELTSAHGSKNSILVHSATQSYSQLLGSLQRLDVEGNSMALISEYPSSLYEDSRPESYRSGMGVDSSDMHGKEGSTILSNLSSDSSRAANRYEDLGSAVYVSASDAPLREPLEIDLFDKELKTSLPEGDLPLPRKVYCSDCGVEVVPIVSFQATAMTWWERLMRLGEVMKCCHEARPTHEDIVHICRKCAKELHRSKVR